MDYTADTATLDARTAQWLYQERAIPTEVTRGLVTTLKGYPAFEFRKNGKLLYRKVRIERGGSKTFRRDRKGVDAVLFNLDSLRAKLPNENTPLIISEGELDCLSWMAAGATHVVSVPDGAQRTQVGEGDIDPLQDTGYQWLWEPDGKLLHGLRQFKRIILATDADQPGDVLREELAVRLGVQRCWKLPALPDGCKDANDVLKTHGEGALTDLLDRAEPMAPTNIIGLSDVPAISDRPAYPVVWGSLREKLIFTTPELLVITGEPGAGKSQFAFALMLEMARLYRMNGFVIQFEDHVSRLKKDALAYAQRWSKNNALPGAHAHCGDDPEEWVRRRIYTVPPPNIGDDEPDMTLAWVKAQVEAAVLQKGCKFVILDPWNEIEHCWGGNESETQYTNRALRELKSWTRRLNIVLCIVTHPGKQVAQKTIDEISLYDVSGSAAWKNKADHGVIVKRSLDLANPDAVGATRTMIDIKVDKCKDWSLMGRPGKGILDFDEDARIYLSV